MLDGKQHFICAKDYALFVPSGAVLSEDDFEGKPLTDKTDAPNGAFWYLWPRQIRDAKV